MRSVDAEGLPVFDKIGDSFSVVTFDPRVVVLYQMSISPRTTIQCHRQSRLLYFRAGHRSLATPGYVIAGRSVELQLGVGVSGGAEAVINVTHQNLI